MTTPATVMLADPFTHTAGFGGLCAVIAAIIAFSGAWITTRQRRNADDANIAEMRRRRELEAHDAETQRLWDRYVWLVEHANDLGIDLVVSLLGRLTDSAERLHEPDLVAFTREFTIELFDVASGPYPSQELDEQSTLDLDDVDPEQEDQ